MQFINSFNFFKILIAIFLLLTSFFVVFSNLDSIGVQKWDEQTNIDVINSSTNSFPVLKNQEAYFFEKPPLWYWSTIIVKNIFGDGITQYRIISSICYLLILILVFYLCFKSFSFYPAVASVIILISSQQLVRSHFDFVFSTHSFKTADLDCMLIFFCVLTSLFIFLSLKNPRFILIAGITTGLGIMTKGLIAYVPIISFIGCLMLARINFKKILIFWAIILSIIIALPWHLFMLYQFKYIFIYDYFFYHNLMRVTGSLENHSQSIFFYIKNLINPNYFIWSWLFGLSLLQLLSISRLKNNFMRLFSLVNIVIYLTIISLTKTKLAWYDLYLYPFISIFIGSFVQMLLDKGKTKNLTKKRRITRLFR